MYFETALNRKSKTVKEITVDSYAGGILKDSSLDDRLFEFTNLQRLTIYADIRTISPKIKALQNLEYIYISSSNIQEIPKEIAALHKLQTLNIRGPQLKSLPKEIAQLQKLQQITIWGSGWRELPEGLEQLRDLKALGIYRSPQLRKLDRLEEGFSQLEFLALSKCHLHTKDLAPIFSCTELQTLILSENEVKSIPKDIIQLKKLSHLVFQASQIEEIPEFILQLDQLQSIYIDGNKLKKFPTFLKQLTELKQLQWENNDFGSFDKGLLEFDSEVINNKKNSKERQAFDKLLSNLKQLNFSKKSLDLFFNLKNDQALKRKDYQKENFIEVHAFPDKNFKNITIENLLDYMKEEFSTNPLKPKSEVFVVGKTPLKKTEIKNILKEAGISYSAKITENTTHLIVGSNLKNPQLLQAYTLISPQQFQEYSNKITNPYLLEEESEDNLEHISALLFSGNSDNENLGLELLKGGGIPKSLATELFAVYKFSENKKTASKAKKLLISIASTDLLEKIKQRINLKSIKDYYKTNGKLEIFLDGTELKGWKLAQYAYKIKPEIWYPQAHLGLKSAPKEKAISFLKTFVQDRVNNIKYFDFKEKLRPYASLFYQHCNFIQELRFEDISTIPEGISAMTELKNIRLWFMKRIRLPEDFEKLPNLETLALIHTEFEHPNKDITRLSQIPKLRKLELSSSMQSNLHPKLAELDNIEELVISQVLKKEDIELLGQMKNLKILDYGSSHYSDFNKDFLPLRNLEKLRWSVGFAKRVISPSIQKFTKLKSLTIEGAIDIPDELNQLRGMEELYINLNYGAPHPVFARSINQLFNLKSLTIRAKVEGLESILANFQELEELELYHNELDLEKLIQALIQLPKLKKFRRFLRPSELQEVQQALPNLEVN